MKTMTKLFAILTILATSAPASAYIIGGDLDDVEGDAIVGTGSPDYIIGGDLDEIQPPFVD